MLPASTGLGARFRRFGACLDDLQVDLAAPRPHVITELLARCMVPAAGREVLWDLPVGKRIALLLRLAAADGVEEFDAELRCASCRSSFEVTLTVEEMLAAAGERGDPVEVRWEGGVARFRRPTGRDQLAWLERSYADEAALAAGMAESLALDAMETPLAAIEAAMDEADPLMRAAVTAACPECGREDEYETDPAGMALAHLATVQGGLFQEVDALASRYHWSEAEILGLPEWRRKRYVAMAQRETH
jgi:hypothetical protein